MYQKPVGYTPIANIESRHQKALSSAKRANMAVASGVKLQADSLQLHFGATSSTSQTEDSYSQRFKKFRETQWASLKKGLEKTYSRLGKAAFMMVGAAYFTNIPDWLRSFFNLEERIFFTPIKACSIYSVKDTNLRTQITPMDFTDPHNNKAPRLKVWHRIADPGKPTVIYLHGRGTNISEPVEMYQMFVKLGYGFFAIDPAGYGESEGRATEETFCNAVPQARQLAARYHVPMNEQILMGHSLGGAGVIDAAARCDEKDKPKAVVVVSTFVTPKSAARQKRESFKSFGGKWLMKLFSEENIKVEFNSGEKIKTIAKHKIPTLILHPKEDKDILPAQGRGLAKRYKEAEGAEANLCTLKKLEHMKKPANGRSFHMISDELCEAIEPELKSFIEKLN